MERLYLLREIANNLPEKSDPTVVLAIHPMDEQSRPVAHRLLAALRKEGTPSIGIFGQIRLKKAFTLAEKEKALFIGLIGEDEIKQGTISLKHLKTGIQKSVPVTPIDSLLASLRKPWEE